MYKLAHIGPNNHGDLQDGRGPELPAPPADLYPPRAERQRIEDFLTRELISANEGVAQGAVVPTHDLEVFRRELAEFDFRVPQSLQKSLEWTIAQMKHGLVHVNHPRYFGLFNPAPTFPAQCADRIAASFNPQLATFTTSPAAVEIEAHVIRAVARRAGFPPGVGGHFTTSGSEANYTALLCALTRSNPQFGSEGSRSFKGQPVFYVSRESHLAWLKIAHQVGVGRSAVRLIATDGSGRMSASALEAALNRDLADGCIPTMIVSTAGTTNAGMIDPISACAELARKHEVWHHVDAAWGGALIASEMLRPVLAGIERADSVTIDAHKWFATTMACGMFITQHPKVLSSTFQVSTTFMPSNLASLDPYVNTVQWSRRFSGLRLFLSLAAAGWSGYARHVERTVELAALLKAQLMADGWTMVNDSPLAVLCFRPPQGSGEVKSIVNRVLATGRAWVAAAMFERDNVIRACITHGETAPDDVFAVVGVLRSCAGASEGRLGLATSHGPSSK
jgi:glutamate/tyrosine decarboxylase-like PLP-dependent enzyme